MSILKVFSNGQLFFLIIVTLFFIWSFLLSLISCIKDCIMKFIEGRHARRLAILDKLNVEEEETNEQ